MAGTTPTDFEFAKMLDAEPVHSACGYSPAVGRLTPFS